jgi:hypothetical protein
MVSSGLLRRVALVRTDVSEEPGASFIRVTKIGELGTTQAATSNRRTLRRNFVTLMKDSPGSSETSVLTRATRRSNSEDTILHSHRRENLKSYTGYFFSTSLKINSALTISELFRQSADRWRAGYQPRALAAFDSPEKFVFLLLCSFLLEAE